MFMLPAFMCWILPILVLALILCLFLAVLPDFAQVYGFIGSVFDPSATDHLQNLKRMDPIDVETVQFRTYIVLIVM